MYLLRRWYSFGQDVEETIGNIIERKAKFVAKHPIAWTVLFCAIAAVCGVGLMKMKMVVVTDKLWTPPDSQAAKDLDIIDVNFGLKPRGGPVLFQATSSVSNNLVSLEAFETLWDVHEKVINTVQADNMTYNDLCYNRDPQGNCMVMGVLQFFKGNRTLYNNIVHTVQDLQLRISRPTFPDGSGYVREQIFGNYTLSPVAPFNMISCTNMVQFYFINGRPLETAMKWERQMVKAMDDVSTADVQVFRNSNSAYDDELAKSTADDMPLLLVMYAIFVAMTFFTLSKRASLLDTRIGLSITGLLLLVLAVVAGFGVAAGLGVGFSYNNIMIAFLIACLGVNDMYILTGAFDAQDPATPVEDRMARAMRQCGKSLLYTALTTSAAFFLGAYSEYFGIQTFCYYAGTTVFANYLLQVNIFAPAIVLDARRRESRRWDLLCCVTSPRAERTVVPQDALEQGGQHVDEQDQPIAKGESKGEVDPAIAKYAPSETPTNAEDQAPSPMPSDKPVAAKPAYVRRAAEMSYLEYFFSELYYPVIAHPATRLFLFCGFCGLLIANIYGTFKVEQALDIAEVLPTDSFVREFIETARPLQLFAAEQSAPVEIILPDLPYHNQTVQEEIFRLQQAFLNVTEYNKGPMISWLTGYYMWVKAIPAPARPPLNAQGFSTREDKFYLSVKKFLSTAPGSRFKKDVIFMNSTDDGPTPIRIRMSRLTAFHNNVVGPLNTTYTMNHARRLVHEANFTAALPIANSTHNDAFIFSLPYIKAEGYKISIKQTFTILIAALVGVAGVSLLVLKPHGLIVPAVAVITVAATYVNVIGNFPRWGWALDLNFITMLLITSTIALMVDYILHVLQHYHTQSFSTPPLERLKTCVTQIGPPIFMGCLTAWIAIIPMAFAKSFIFRALFRVFFCVIAYSLGHALLLLPAILPTLSYLQLESCAANGGCGAATAVKSASKEQELVPVDANAPQDDKSAAEVQPFATEEP